MASTCLRDAASAAADSGFFQDDPVVDEVQFLDSSLDPFLLSEDILEVKPVRLRPENRNILQH
jgi:hypothetical protein